MTLCEVLSESERVLLATITKPYLSYREPNLQTELVDLLKKSDAVVVDLGAFPSLSMPVYAELIGAHLAAMSSGKEIYYIAGESRDFSLVQNTFTVNGQKIRLPIYPTVEYLSLPVQLDLAINHADECFRKYFGEFQRAA